MCHPFPGWGWRGDYIGEAARSTEEKILHNKEIELGRCRRNVNWRWNPQSPISSPLGIGFQLALMDRVAIWCCRALVEGSFTFHADSNRASNFGVISDLINPEQCWAPHRCRLRPVRCCALAADTHQCLSSYNFQ